MTVFTYLVDTQSINKRAELKDDIIQYDTNTGILSGMNPPRVIREQKGLIASNYLSLVLGYRVLEVQES